MSMNDLTNNTTMLEEVLDMVENLPEAGSGSSGESVETCTLNFEGTIKIRIYASIINENGMVSVGEPTWMDGMYISNGFLDNVICGSIMVLNTDNINFIEGSATVLTAVNGMTLIKTPTVAGESCTISF